MGLFGKAWMRVVSGGPGESGLTDAERVRRDWDLLRAQAVTANERNEIDAIFARHL